MPPLYNTSILCPNYNYGRFISDALLSIVNHNETKSYEILVLDDGSTDDSHAILSNLHQKYSQINYIKNEKNEGVERAFNKLLSLAKGRYIHFFGSDDLYFPHALDKLDKLYEQFPDNPLFVSNSVIFTSPDIMQSIKRLPYKAPLFLSADHLFSLFQRSRFFLAGNAMIYKKELFLQYGPFNPALLFVADWLIHYQCALNKGVVFIPDDLFAQRIHKGAYSQSGSLKTKRAIWQELLALFEKDREKYKRLYQSGVARDLGLRSIYKELLFKPNYWRYLAPMCKRAFLQKWYQNRPNKGLSGSIHKYEKAPG